jgi:hypothetical protein
VWGTLQRERVQVGQRELGPPGAECTGAKLTTQHGHDFQIEQLWRGEAFPPQPGPGTVSIAAVISEGGRDDAGVNDEHARPATWTPPS